MNIIIWIIFGAFIGWIASLVMHTDEKQGTIMNIVVGIVGAAIGGFLMNLFGEPGVTGFNFYSMLVAFIGSIILLWLYKMFTRQTV